MKVLAQGAEAKLFLQGTTVVKDRFSKAYRQPELDLDLRKTRTRREAKVLTTLKEQGIIAPSLIQADDKDMKVSMSFLEGPLLKAEWDSQWRQHAPQFGKIIAKIHTLNIIHGDLTTSNVIVTNHGLGLIDFGLSFFSTKVEDMAVDLHVLKQALTSKHHAVAEESFAILLNEYVKGSKEGKAVLARLTEVEQRGRYKMKQWIDGKG
jgi:TP53 regulating kinase and related kinases